MAKDRPEELPRGFVSLDDLATAIREYEAARRHAAKAKHNTNNGDAITF